ncbi:PREDICTED: sodium-coupled neutral amino acid transporter 3 [Myotis davidii]|uniref:sodium-coupled neutral amino acid transporter 3 n=1 Tax=Myotis davidii TaxID=225400 RepID=UPI0007676197|nr:PREDICTED: sodium-coupled neutral amino acid transporter 3 [Myotis davidii]
MEAPLQTEMVELVPNGKHSEGLHSRGGEGGRGAGRDADPPPPSHAAPQFEGKTSFGMSVFNLSNAIMGSGILGLAFAMANTGIILFLGGPLTRCLPAPPPAMSSYLYIIKSELPLVIQTFLNLEEKTSDWYMDGNYLVILVSATIILPLALMRQLGYLGYSSGFSLTCMVFFLVAVIYKKFQVPCPLLSTSANITSNSSLGEGTPPLGETFSSDSCTPNYFTLNIQTAYTIPIMAFAFVCHPEVLPIYTELKDPSRRKMQHISNLSIAVMYVMYFLAALFGYLTFYGRCWAAGVRRAIQQMLFPDRPFSWLRHVVIAVSLLTCINLLVIFAPNILGIFGIIGATSAPCLIFIFPAIFYFRIVPTEREPAKSTPKILALCFAVLGFLMMTMSLSFIIIDWVSGTSRSGGSH